MLLAPPKVTPASLFTVALLAFPAVGAASADAQAAPAAPVKVTAASSQVSSGSVLLAVRNRSAVPVAGRVSAKAGRTAAGSAAYRVRGRRTASVKLTLSAAARRKLASDKRLRLTLRATAKGRRSVTSSITVTGRSAGSIQGASPQGASPQGGAPQGGGQQGATPRPGAGAGAQPGAGTPGGGTPPPESPDWVARTGGAGAYDDFAFTLSGGQITVTQRPLAYLQCSENGGSYRTYGSWELFGPTGPWTLGAQSQEMTASTPLVNLLAGSSPHTARYQLRSARSGNGISGQLYMSAAWSNYDAYNNRIVFVNCFGTTSFDAVQR